MRTNEFDFYLDEKLIAQTPLLDRTASRLMVMDKISGELTHTDFSHIVDYLEEGDCLVLNDTKVLPARLLGTKLVTNASIELMLLRNTEGDVWETLVKPLRRVKVGTKISFGEGLLIAECIEIIGDGIIHVEFTYKGIFLEVLDELGEMPLPPYIREKLEIADRYQTVYAKHVGSVAAPTAGLHFTKELLAKIDDKGIKIAYITLHVGLGTFRPIKVDNVLEHKMHSEFYSLSEDNAQIMNNAKRIVAVGTTSTRTLETIKNKFDVFTSDSGWTDIFIYPGYKFKAINALITNFHLPKSTLIMLVSAFSSKANVMNAYETAVKEEYRFFSFGDSMFIK